MTSMYSISLRNSTCFRLHQQLLILQSYSGEGGTFAVYSLLARYSNIVRRDPNLAGTVKMDRHLTNDLKPINKGVRTFIEKSRIARVILKLLGVLGVAMVMR